MVSLNQESQRLKPLRVSTLVIFVSADSELNAAAASEGLLVENPNNYP